MSHILRHPILIAGAIFAITAAADADSSVPLRPAQPTATGGAAPGTATAGHVITKSDIPPGLSQDLRSLIVGTFSEVPAERGLAAEALGKLKGRAAPSLPFLIRLLGDAGLVRIDGSKDPHSPLASVDVDRVAKEAICEIGKPSVDPCIAALGTEQDRARTAGLMEILARLKDPRGAQPLIARLSDVDSRVRRAAALAVSYWPDPRFVEPLVAALNDPADSVRMAAALAISRLRDPKVVPPLLARLDDKNEFVRMFAAAALGQQNDPRVVPALLSILHDSSQRQGVLGSAAQCLGVIGDRAATDGLLAVLKDNSKPEIARICATTGLTVSKNLHFVKPLVVIAEDSKQPVGLRIETVNALANIAGKAEIPLLTGIAVAAREDDRVRCCAAICVIQLTNGEINDAAVVAGLEGRYVEPNECGHSWIDAVVAIAARGTSGAVRAAGRALLKKTGHESLIPTDKSIRADGPGR